MDEPTVVMSRDTIERDRRDFSACAPRDQKSFDRLRRGYYQAPPSTPHRPAGTPGFPRWERLDLRP